MAAEFCIKGLNSAKERVWQKIRQAGPTGMTTDEVAEALEMSVLYVRPRVSEMGKAGLVHDSGRQRYNASERLATVWVVKE